MRTGTANATSVDGNNRCLVPPVGAKKTEADVRKEFSLITVQFSSSQLADAGDVTKEGARHWKDASRAPSSASLINAARSLPCVREWLLSNVGVEREVQPQSVDGVLCALYAIAAGQGEEAIKARDLISKLIRS